jgi:hypothetical protein
MRDQGAQPAYSETLHPHVTPDRVFQAQAEPRHQSLVPQRDANWHQDQGSQGYGPKQNETAGGRAQAQPWYR